MYKYRGQQRRRIDVPVAEARGQAGTCILIYHRTGQGTYIAYLLATLGDPKKDTRTVCAFFYRHPGVKGARCGCRPKRAAATAAGTLRWSWLLGPGPWIRAAEAKCCKCCVSSRCPSAVIFLAMCLRISRTRLVNDNRAHESSKSPESSISIVS